MNYAVEFPGEPAQERQVRIDVEISNRQYIATATVTRYDVDDYHVEWTELRRPGARWPESGWEDDWRKCLDDYRGDAIEEAVF